MLDKKTILVKEIGSMDPYEKDIKYLIKKIDELVKSNNELTKSVGALLTLNMQFKEGGTDRRK